MPLPKSFTTVTPFSKILAAVLFITFPFVGFLAGMQYQKVTSSNQTANQINPTPTPHCNRYETICDPSYTDPNGGCAPKRICVDPSPTPAPDFPTAANQTCGGRDNTQCPKGYYCEYLGDNLYAGGKCVKEDPPQLDPPQYACTDDAKTCPDGSSVGRTGPNCKFATCPGKKN